MSREQSDSPQATIIDVTAALRAAEEQELALIQRAIRQRVGREADALRSYRRRFERTMRASGEPTTARAVFQAALAADLVIIGDYHTLPAAQRTALTLARALARRRPLVLGLEMVRTEHQPALDAFHAGAVAESALRNIIRYNALWPFPWAHYGPLIALGREPGIRLLALDGRGSLEQRDRIAADRLAASRAVTSRGPAPGPGRRSSSRPTPPTGASPRSPARGLPRRDPPEFAAHL